MLGMLFMLAVIVIAIALLPAALGVLGGALPWLIAFAVVVVIGVGAVILTVWPIAWVSERFDWVWKRSQDQLGPNWGWWVFFLLWGTTWTGLIIVGLFVGPWDMERLRWTVLAAIVGLGAVGLPIWRVVAHRKRRASK